MQTKAKQQGRTGTRSSLKCGTGLHYKCSILEKKSQSKTSHATAAILSSTRPLNTRSSLRCGTGLHQRKGRGAQQRIVRAETQGGGHRKQEEDQGHRKMPRATANNKTKAYMSIAFKLIYLPENSLDFLLQIINVTNY